MYTINKKNNDIFIENLFHWHKENYRDLPWRRTTDPFYIIVAEMMLQKTDSRKVETVFKSFIKKYPTPDSLSKANVKQIKKDIQLLGIHKRAERLKNLGNDIVEKYAGEVPRKKEDLIGLMGVGDYIANAVLCFAYNEDSPLLDTNIVRVLERVFAVKTTKSRARTDKELWKTVGKMIPKDFGREFNLAILDFSATVCKAKKPLHSECPLQGICNHYNSIIRDLATS